VVTAIVGLVILALVIALVVIVAMEPGPPPQDVAIAYEEAWDRLDFEALWNLSGDELRDGLGRRDFVTAKQAAYARHASLGNLAGAVVVEQSQVGSTIASVETRLSLRDGSTARNDVELTKRAGKWLVVAYRLRGSDVPGDDARESGRRSGSG
jgi:hypothetical protein